MKKLLFLVLFIVLAGCSTREKQKYVVVHHKNVRDTVLTSDYTFYLDGKCARMYEGGVFTEVEYIKAIE